MDASELALLAKTVRDAIAGVATAGGGVAAVDGTIADLGWRDMLDAEPDAAVEIVFGALGETNGTATALDDVLLLGLGVVSSSSSSVAVLLPEGAGWAPPGRIEGPRVRARGLAESRALTANDVVVVCDAGRELRVVSVPLPAVEMSAVRGIDPDAGMHVVDLDVDAEAEVIATVDQEAWDAAVALARRALGYQTLGATRAMVDLAREHALERAQFGRPIARFQAVRHRLADALVAIEALDATLGAAADAPSTETAMLAKAVAGRTAHSVAAHCQQVLGGIGFTTDHPFHRYLKRTMVLDRLLGSADDLVVALGRQLLANRAVPTLIEL
jgi:hypothetical protein